MKPGAIIAPKFNDPARAKFYVRSKTRNGWLRCHIIKLDGDVSPRLFKFRAREMEVVG